MKVSPCRYGVILRSIAAIVMAVVLPSSTSAQIGEEKAVPVHLQDGEEFEIPLPHLLDFGGKLFSAVFTVQEGQGRPLAKGNGNALSDPSDPLIFPRNFNRVSTPDANSCAGCHAQPFGSPGGDGDFVANVFVLAQRFDFVTFAHSDGTTAKGARAEDLQFATLDDVGNSRLTLGMWGSGYIEMLARQMTTELRAIVGMPRLHLTVGV